MEGAAAHEPEEPEHDQLLQRAQRTEQARLTGGQEPMRSDNTIGGSEEQGRPLQAATAAAARRAAAGMEAAAGERSPPKPRHHRRRASRARKAQTGEVIINMDEL